MAADRKAGTDISVPLLKVLTDLRPIAGMYREREIERERERGGGGGGGGEREADFVLYTFYNPAFRVLYIVKP